MTLSGPMFPYIHRPNETLIEKCLRLTAENRARMARERKPAANDNVAPHPVYWWERYDD